MLIETSGADLTSHCQTQHCCRNVLRFNLQNGTVVVVVWLKLQNDAAAFLLWLFLLRFKCCASRLNGTESLSSGRLRDSTHFFVRTVRIPRIALWDLWELWFNTLLGGNCLRDCFYVIKGLSMLTEHCSVLEDFWKFCSEVFFLVQYFWVL